MQLVTMSESKNKLPETEREQLQEDIQRLQLVLQADDELQSEDSDNENALHIDTGYQIDAQQPGPSHAPDNLTVDATNDDEVAVIQLSEEADLPLNPETTLALNRAYQELLLDSLRKIEVALAENRDKQNILEAELAEQGTKTEKSSSSSSKKYNINQFSMPYFKNASGKNPPINVDVTMKLMLDERKQDVKPPAPWQLYQRNLLIDAVRQDSFEQLLRPLMNRKELEMEKLMGLQKEHQKDDRIECQRRIRDIDDEIEEVEHISPEQLLKIVDEEKIDWLRISNTVFEGKRDVPECQAMWKNAMHPLINKEKWTEEENLRLIDLVDTYQMRNWDTVAVKLRTNRTAFQCLQHYQQHLNDSYSKREWTQEEDDLLAEVIESCKQGNRISWNQVSYYIEGRSASQCEQRWKQIDPIMKRGKWTDEEDCILLAAVKLYGSKDWVKIQQHIPGRTASQCRDRFVNALDPNLKPPSMWTYEEDKKLIQLVKHFGGPSKCSWVKVATELKGRTDNMVLCRFKRLMEWKKKSEWFESKSDETKESLGLVDIRASRMKYEKKKNGGLQDTYNIYRNEALAYRLAELTSGVNKEDYLKQLQDKMSGSLVVPRPPLLYRYTARSVVHVWERKEQLRKLIEAHINQVMKDKSVKSIDMARIPEKAGELFRPLTMMSKKQKEKMTKFLKNKQPCDIFVKDLLTVTGKVSRRGRGAMSNKVLARLKKDADMEKKIRDILLWKCHRQFISRSRRGRPKTYYLFHSRANPKHEKQHEENAEEMNKITTKLFLNALNTEGKNLLQKYRFMSGDVSDDVQGDIDLLDSVFNENIVPTTIVKSESQTGTQGIETQKNICGEPASRVTMATTSGEPIKTVESIGNKEPVSNATVSNSGDNSNISVTAAEKISVSSENGGNLIVNSGDSNPGSSSADNTKLISSGKVTDLRESSALTSTSSQGQRTVVTPSGQVQNSRENAPMPPLSVQDQRIIMTPGGQVQNLSVGPQKLKSMPFLPPNLTTVCGFESLLMQRKLLITKADFNYNAFYYKQMSEQNLATSQVDKYVPNKVDLNSVMKEIDKKVGSLAVKGKRAAGGKFGKPDGVSPKKRQRGPDGTRDPLKNIRSTPEYELLKARFQATFTWPALLATIVPPSGGDLELSEATSTPNDIEEEEEEDVGVSGRKKKVSISHGKSHYKSAIKGSSKKRETYKKVIDSRNRNKEAIQEGRPVEQIVRKKHRKEFTGEKRVSSRIQERKNVDEIIEKMTHNENDEYGNAKSAKNRFVRGQMLRGVGRTEDVYDETSIPVDDDTIIEIISEPQTEMTGGPMIEVASCTTVTLPSDAYGNNVDMNKHVTTANTSLNMENQNINMTAEIGNGIDTDGSVFMAVPVGHIDETTGTLQPPTTQSQAYPVALVVNHSVTVSENTDD